MIIVYNSYNQQNRCSPLFFACKGGYSNIAQLLIEEGAKVNEKNWVKFEVVSMLHKLAKQK